MNKPVNAFGLEVQTFAPTLTHTHTRMCMRHFVHGIARWEGGWEIERETGIPIVWKTWIFTDSPFVLQAKSFPILHVASVD